ncbi:uncharacterized protein N7500_007692 [Penicillium coprophilum]|uniref:uncharacterized protein n=1 Tax=Penicillium coprophilum TaxID=36646 RepID=UPI002386E62A|nr:uncharacterized protein N7500_007692 [Penicillium coprophilum]KAJ5158041.1 hypothetical protein N7500_007692 [Penicillium coprophilum]
MSPDVINLTSLFDGRSSEYQIQHRVDLFNKWKITPGSRILEVGCGQGDCTLVAAYMLGDQGHVTAIDPAPTDYGTPLTLGEAQDKLRQTPIGDRMTFYQSNLQDFLDSGASEQVYDYAMLVHSVWYFPSVDVLQQMLAALRGRTKCLLIAEYSLDIRGDNAALPHLLAAISQAEFNSRSNILDRDDNIQSIISQQTICALAKTAGWELQKEEIVESPKGQEDAEWEVRRVLSEEYSIRSESHGDASRQNFANALIDAVAQSTRVIGPNPKLRTLSTWLGSWV